MASNKKEQKAGDGSRLVQADRDVHIHEGPSYAEIIEIVGTEATRIVKDYIPEAHLEASAEALKKVEELTLELAKRFENKPNDLIDAFKDPSFNYDWSDATRAALESKDDEVEKIIVDLIENRISKKDSPRTKIITGVALQAAGKMGADSVNGIALTWILGYTYLLHEGFPFEWFLSAQINRLKSSIERFTLPDDDEWLEDLDALNLIRLQDSGITNINQFFEIMRDRFKPFLVPGIPESEVKRLVDPIRSKDPLIDHFVVTHPLKDGFFIIPYENSDTLKSRINEDAQQLSEFEELLGQNQFGAIDGIAESNLRSKLSADGSFKLVEEWWNRQMKPHTLTKPGRIIAYSLTKDYTGPIKDIASFADLIR